MLIRGGPRSANVDWTEEAVWGHAEDVEGNELGVRMFGKVCEVLDF